MAKLLASTVLAASAGVVASTHGEPWLYTVSGACDAQGGIDGLSFVRMGTTASGAPYYKAIDADTYMYHDADCMGSNDGTPRWIIDTGKPDLTKRSDLDNDRFCDYIGRIDSDDVSHPPTQGMWTMNCGGKWEQKYLILLEGTTTWDPYNPGRTTTMPYRSGAQSLMMSGVCPLKGFLNGVVFDEAGVTLDGRPYYKAQNREEYLFYDADCDGSIGGNIRGRWVVDNSRPSTMTLKDLDQDGKCDYHMRFDGDSQRPPAFGSWTVYCGSDQGGWVARDVTLRDVGRNAVNAAPRVAVQVLAALAAAFALVMSF